MISQEFDFHAPKELSDVFKLLQRYGGDAKLLAGGMSLVPMMTLGLVQPKAIVSLNHLAGLDYVREDAAELRIGAMTRHKTVMTHPLIKQFCPLLAQAASCVGDTQVRNRGSIGGSLAHADPAADYPPVLMVAGARLLLQSAAGNRMVHAKDFFTGLMQTSLGHNELIVEIAIPKMANVGSSYQRLHRVEGSFPIVNAAAIVQKNGKAGLLAIGGAGSKAVVIDLAKHLAGGVTAKAVQAIADAAYIATSDAPEDINASGEYRRRMAMVYAQRVIRAAAANI